MPCFSKFYYMLGVSFFPTSFKLANIRSVIQKGPKKSNKNYRSVSILVDVSKIHEKRLFNQMSSYFEKYVDNGKTFATLPIDLPKAFDCLPCSPHC